MKTTTPPCFRLRLPGGHFLAALVLLTGITTARAATVRYVDVNRTNATPPFPDWSTAANNIQDAVDAAVSGDEIVVTNGTYASVAVNKAVTVHTVNGPQFAIISGDGEIRNLKNATP